MIRVGATYYWFTTELTALPYWAKTTLALWTSADGQHWHRQATLFGPSSADQTGSDRRAALWAPIPVYDQNDQHWLIFYISYRSKPDLVNYDGEVWEAKSTIAGSSGISGPYIDVGVVLSEQIGSRQPWEVVQGDDSFEPFQLPDRSWRAFYGSSNEHSVWQVGMLSAPDLSGPWTRVTGNPLPISSSIENPIVVGMGNEFIALYDDVSQTHNVGCMWSAKGTIWSACPSLPAGKGVRTPVGLVPAASVSPKCTDASIPDVLYRLLPSHLRPPLRTRLAVVVRRRKTEAAAERRQRSPRSPLLTAQPSATTGRRSPPPPRAEPPPARSDRRRRLLSG